MENEIQNKLNEQSEKIDAIYKSVEKTRKYFLVIIWITVIAFILPLIAMIFVIPSFMSSYMGSLDGLL
jgi:type II secretory pathway component PulF|tara:strand:+ start:267 stop:470 length:204 start_codon:yes stop_codon:yes gene_type:complete